MKSIRRKCGKEKSRASSLGRGLCAALTLLTLLACLGCNRKPAGEAPLKVGMEMAYPPFEMRDTQGNPAGVSVDLAHALADYLHQQVVIENIPFSGLIPALKTNKIDCVISSMTATPERAESIDFSDPYLKTGLCLLLPIHSPVRAIGDLDKDGMTVVVKQGTTGQAYARDHLTHARVLVLEKETSCVLEVTQGKADAFIYDQMSTYTNWMNNSSLTRPLLVPFQAEQWAIGVRKGNEVLLSKINQFLASYKAQGGFEKLGDRYLPEQKAAFAKMNVPFVF